MSLQTRLSDLITRTGTEFKAVRILISGSGTGDVSGLNTTATDLVAGINEVKVTADAAAGGGVAINDAVTNLTDAWSSQKIDGEISSAVAALVGAAPATLDTLQEIADAVNDDANFSATITALVGTKQDASTIGNPDVDLVALFDAAIT